MASRRLLLASSLQRRSWDTRRYSILSSVSTSIPLEHHYQRREQQQHAPSLVSAPPLIQIRSFSAIEKEKKESMRDRARHGAQRAREGAQKGAKVARKGAKTAGEMLQQYGPVFVGTYMSVYFISWGALFIGMDSGLLDPVQIMSYIGGGVEEGKSTVHLVVEYMEKYAWTKPYAATVEENPHFANLAVAWVTNKFTEPARLAITLGIVPKLARHFGFVHVDEIEEDEKKNEEESVEENDTVDKTKDETKEGDAMKVDDKTTK